MIYIETGSTDVYFNFGTEYYFTAVNPLDDVVFLFWRTTPTLMVGKYQNIPEEIDLEYAERNGIQIVRRMSGGGTIYTDLGGWQFTFIDPGDDGAIRFENYISPVIDALRALQVPASFNGRNDLVIDGKKFSGNAQYKLNGRTVHHGSLLFDTDIDQMVRSTRVDEYKIRSKSIKSVRDRVTNILPYLREPLDPEAFKDRMVSRITGESGGRRELTAEDRAAIEAIADERFRSWDARYGSNPRFTLTKTGRFAGGKVEVRLDARHGIITDAALSGDFFGTEGADEIAPALIGCRFGREDILAALRSRGLDEAIYGVSPEELTDLIIS